MKEVIRYFDCFAGIGGFHCGAQRIKSDRYSFKHVAYCEVEANAQKVYEVACDAKNIQKINDVRDVATKKNPEGIKVKDFDMLFAGFPCQSFSNVGYRKGFDDPRGQLFFYILDMLDYYRYGWTGNPDHLPNASSISKQVTYGEWVKLEVLPAIRRHGLYAVDDILSNQDALIETFQAYKAERMQRLTLEAENAVQKQQLIEMQPKASYYDVVLNSSDLVSITEISKDYGWSAQKMNEYLHTKGVQFKLGGRIWTLYQKHAEKGYTSTKTHTYPATDGTIHTKVHTYWTQKGRLFIYDLLKADGILPLIE